MSRRGLRPPSLTVSAILPAFVRVLAARDGHVWVQEHARAVELMDAPADIASNRWSVFDGEGVWLGTVEMPPGLQVREIGAGYVLGVWQDEFEVDYVRVHRIVSP
jgi:hypothetical protein